MATDLEQLVLSISADNRQMLRVLKKLEGDTSSTTRKVEKQFDQMAKKIDARLSGVGKGSFKNLLGGVAGALGIREIINLTNAWTDLNSSVALYAGGAEQGKAVLERLGEVARRTYTDLQQTADVYIQNANTLRELGYSADQTFDFVESLSYALDITGARGQHAETIMSALSKAMAHGSLQGQNLNTIIQQGGRVSQALAEGLGVTTIELRKLGAEGKISTASMIAALTSQMGKLRKEAEGMPPSIADGVRLLQNALLEYVGNADTAAGISGKISEALKILADNFDKTADVALQLAGVLAGGLLGRSMVNMVRTLGLGTTALVQFTRALTAARSMATLATAFGGLSAAAGPVGILVGGAVATALIVAASNAGEARDRIDRLNDEMDRLGIKAKPAAESVDDAADAIDNLANESRVQLLKDINDELDRMRSGGGIWTKIFGGSDEGAKSLTGIIQQAISQGLGARGVSQEALQNIARVAAALRDTKMTAAEAYAEADKIGKLEIHDGARRLNNELIKSIGHWEDMRKTQALSADATELEGYLQSLNDINGILSQMAEGEIITNAQHKQLQQVIEELKTTGQVSETSKEALASIANAKFAGSIIAEINAIIPKLRTLAEEAIAAGTTVQQILAGPVDEVPESGTWDRGARVEARQTELSSAAWEREQLRRAKLGKDQLALENEIARVRKQASDDNEKLTEAQIKRIAEANLAGNAARGAEGKKPKQDRDAKAYENLTKRINENIEVIRAENAALAGVNPLVNDYGFALEKARVQQELLTAAKKAGVEVTPELEMEIEALADTYALATVEAEKLTEKHDEIRESAEAALGTARDVTQGLIDGFIEGKSAADIMANALKKIGNHLINDVLNNLFKIQNMGGGGGGFLSGLLGMFGGGGGGINYGALSASGKYLFSSGGYTGPGPKNKPAGVVHAGEVVWSQDDIRKAGGVAAVEAMRKGAGSVAMPSFSAPAMPKMAAGGASGQQIIVHFAPQIDASGADPAAIQRLEGGLQKLKAEIPAQVIQGVRKAQQSNVKLG